MAEERDRSGRFVIGHRPLKRPGAKSELRQKILDFVETRWSELPELYDSLKAKDKAQFLLELLPFVTARLKQIDVVDSADARQAVANLFPLWLNEEYQPEN